MRNPAQGLAPPSSPAGERLVSLDLARCIAVGMMLLAHITDQLISPSQWATPAGVGYGAIRGITAPLFLLVSGWSFAASTLPAWGEFRRRSPRLVQRGRRAVALFIWGYALTLPWWAEGFPSAAPEAVWAPFFAFGVLQTAGSALIAGHLLVRLTRSPRSFTAFCAILAIGVVLASPAVQVGASQVLPQPLLGAFDPSGVSGGFPLAPWLGYFFLGSALGGATLQRRWTGAQVFVLAGAGGIGALVAGNLLCPAFAWMPKGLFWTASPSIFLHRLGAALLVFALAAGASLALRRLPPALALSGKHALSFYVGHMLLLWGTPLTPGLVHLVAPELLLWQTAMVSAAVWVSIWLAVWAASSVLPGSMAWLRALKTPMAGALERAE